MRAWRFQLALVVGVLGLTLVASAQHSNAPATRANAPAPRRPDFSTFRIISDRNIFNPHRTAANPQRTETVRRLVRTESFALAGTMIYSKGPFAFFEGSSSDYTKVARPADVIGGFTVSNVHPNFVTLTHGTNVVELPVGMQMTRSEGGEWQKSIRPEPAYVSRGEESSRPDYRARQTTAAATSTDESGIPGVLGQAQPGQGGPVIMVNGEAISLPFPPDAAGQGFNIQNLPNFQVLTGPQGELPTVVPVPGGVPANGAPANADDVLTRLRQRAASERGEPR